MLLLALGLGSPSPVFAAAPATAEEALRDAHFTAAAVLYEKSASPTPDAAWRADAAKLLAGHWPKAIEAFVKNLPAHTKVGAYAPRHQFKDALVKSVDPGKGFTIDLGSGAGTVMSWRMFPPETQFEILKQAFPKPTAEELRAELALLALHGLTAQAIDLFGSLQTPEKARTPVEQEVARWIKARDAVRLEAEARAAALKAARQYFSESDAAKKAALLDALADAPISAEDIPPYVKLLAASAHPDQRPGIRDLQKLAVPEAVSAKPVEYSIYVPAKYAPTHAYPLIFGLHGGGGGTGSGEDYMKATSFEIRGVEAIYVCPTSVDLGIQQYWRNPRNETMLLLLTQEMARQFPIDTNRVYLTGYSMGGMGTYFLGPRLADLFAATAPGGGAWCGIYWPAMLNLPTYIYHGKNDRRGKNFTDFPYAQHAADCLKELGYDFVFNAMDCGHGPIPRGEEKKMFDWCLTKKRDPYAKHLIVASPCVKDFMGQAPASRPNRWLALDETGGQNLPMDGCDFGGAQLLKLQMKMGTLDATWSAANQLDVTAQNVKRFRVLLSPALLDLKKPLKVNVNGKTVYDGPAKTSVKFLLRYLDERRDPNLLFAGEIRIDLAASPAK